jgi:hypothetical protein
MIKRITDLRSGFVLPDPKEIRTAMRLHAYRADSAERREKLYHTFHKCRARRKMLLAGYHSISVRR